MMERVNLFIDTDPGIDDILALLLALHSPNVNVVAISTTHGNAPLKAVTENLKVLFDILYVHQQHMAPSDGKVGNSESAAFDDVRIPYKIYSDKVQVAIGADKPIKGQNHFALDVHGGNGLGGLSDDDICQIRKRFSNTVDCDLIKDNPLYEISPRNAADELIHQLKTRPAKTVSVVCLGPCTNLALALQKEPELLKTKLKGVFLMGGAVGQPYPGGNVSTCAEFNFFVDAYAANYVLTQATSDQPFECPVVVVPLDATEACRLTYTVYENHIVPLAKQAALPSFCAGFLEYIYQIIYDRNSIIEESKDVRQMTALAMHDPLCVAIAFDGFYNGNLDNSIIMKRQQHNWIKVECSGIEENVQTLTKGMLLTDGRRWRRRTSNGKDKKDIAQKVNRQLLTQESTPISPSKTGQVEVIMKVDSSKFFENFLKNVFGINWNESKHAWVDKQ